jgi:hypothetical protein
MLGTADFTATSGTTVVLASGATAGDLIRTESFYVSSVLNAIPAVANAVTETYINTGAVTTTKIADANVTQAKLASGVAGNGPAFSVARTTDVSVPNGTSTKVIFATESFDTNSCYDTSNGRFTPNVAGYYQITASLGWLTPPSGQSYDFYIAKNGAIGTPAIRVILSTASQNPIFQGSYLLYLNGSTDYVEIYAYQGTGSTQTIIGGTDRTWFQGFMVRSA